MNNSVIFSGIIKILMLLKNFWQNSGLNKNFLRADSFIVNAIRYSFIGGLFTKPNNSKVLRNCLGYYVFCVIVINIRKSFRFIKKCFDGSYISSTFNELMDEFFKNPLRVFSILVLGFLCIHIVFQFFEKPINILQMVAEICVAALLLLLSQLNLSMKKLLSESLFVRLFKWIMSI